MAPFSSSCQMETENNRKRLITSIAQLNNLHLAEYPSESCHRSVPSETKSSSSMCLGHEMARHWSSWGDRNSCCCRNESCEMMMVHVPEMDHATSNFQRYSWWAVDDKQALKAPKDVVLASMAQYTRREVYCCSYMCSTVWTSAEHIFPV